LTIALERSNGSISTWQTSVLPHVGEENRQRNIKYAERLLKSLLWLKGGYRITVAGDRELGAELERIYSPSGTRKFDHQLMGERIYGHPMEFHSVRPEEAPKSRETDVALGGNFSGCRIGFDLGGSDRKCAAVIDGKVVYSEEIKWDPYFQKDPQYHLDGIRETLRNAADKMPRVDAIGGSSAGVYVDNQVRIASLFRGIPDDVFKTRVVNMFIEIGREWGVPMVVINDGEVTALAGAMEMQDNAVLGVSLGTSQAGGYVTPSGNITDWLNELAFVPVDYRDGAPVDEWSGDRGCGVQYFSQQAVARLAPAAGFDFPDSMPFPDRLSAVQEAMAKGNRNAHDIFETIGTYFGYAIAHYADFYEIRNLLILGRVTSGEGGNIILSTAGEILKTELPLLAVSIRFRTPDEKNKRHGQAVAAASLPALA
jgi:predicted NBD/HSP70 family sugar kinase